MTKPPTEIDPVNSPGLVALQELKYKEDTPEGEDQCHTPPLSVTSLFYL